MKLVQQSSQFSHDFLYFKRVAHFWLWPLMLFNIDTTILHIDMSEVLHNMPAFIHALWITDPSKRAKGLNMQPSPQKKGGARMTSMLYVTDNKPGLIPTLYEKACNFNMSRYYSTGTRDHHFT